MKYYLYVSESKVEMLSSQLKRSIADAVSDLQISMPFVKTAVKRGTASESRFTRVAKVCDHLTRLGTVGTLDEPKDYFAGEGMMNWGTWPDMIATDPEHVFFTLSTASTHLVLAGSAQNIIGNQGMAFRSKSNLTEVLAFLEMIARESVPGPAEGSFKTAQRAYRHLAATSRACQRVEFMARRLAQYDDGHGGLVLVGSPLFVASV